MKRRRLLSNFQMSENRIELICHRNIVIMLYHGEQQAFPKAAGPYEQQIIASIFNRLDKIRPVAVKIILRHDFLEIENAVGESHGRCSLEIVCFSILDSYSYRIQGVMSIISRMGLNA